MIGTIVGAIFIGLIVGALARLILPGRQGIGVIMTILLGAAGSFIGSWVTYRLISTANQGKFELTAFLVGIIVAVILIAIYVGITGRRGTTTADTPMLARGVTFGGFVDAKYERREHDFAAVRIAVGDRSRRRPIRMGLDGLYTRRRKPRRRLLLCGRIGKVQAQLFMGVDSDGFDGLDDLEGQRGSGQPEYRAVAAVAIPERGTQRQSDEVAVELDG